MMSSTLGLDEGELEQTQPPEMLTALRFMYVPDCQEITRRDRMKKIVSELNYVRLAAAQSRPCSI